MGSTRTRIAVVAALAAGGVLAAALVGVGRPETAQGQTAVQPVTGITVMGSGSVRGTPDRADFSFGVETQVKAGTIMFEITGVSEDIARRALSRVAHKMPVRCRFISREKSAA